jgi:hypothetical protein
LPVFTPDIFHLLDELNDDLIIYMVI